MSAYVLIIVLAMPSYDGGVAVHHIQFATHEACEAARGLWNESNAGDPRRPLIKARCHPTGAQK